MESSKLENQHPGTSQWLCSRRGHDSALMTEVKVSPPWSKSASGIGSGLTGTTDRDLDEVYLPLLHLEPGFNHLCDLG